MRDRLRNRAAQRLLKLLAAKLEDHLNGDDLAMETLGDALDDGGFSGDDLRTGIDALQNMAGENGGEGWVAGAPDAAGQRMLSDEEREALTLEAWGYLLGLRAKGALDPEKFERVLDLLVSSGVRPVGEELAREVASRVALEVNDRTDGDYLDADFESAH